MARSESMRGVRFLVLEGMLIVFAVMLGFAVTNWDANRRDRDRAALAVSRIHTELTRNSEELAEVIPYYLEMSERMDSILSADGNGPFDEVELPGWRGLDPPPLRRASFQVAMETGVLEHADFPLVDEIALAYDVQDDFSNSIDNALSTFIGGGLSDIEEFQLIFELLAEVAVVAREQIAIVLPRFPDD